MPGPTARETGDRAAFLARLRERQGPPPADVPHPPPVPGDPGTDPHDVPAIAHRSLDGLDPTDPEALLPILLDELRAVEATTAVVDLREPLGTAGADAVLGAAAREAVVAWRRGGATVERAVASIEPLAVAAAAGLAGAGVAVASHTRATGAVADVAVTSATAAIAATGTLVVDSASAGSRAVSLLATHHLCVVRLTDVVAVPSDVLRAQAAPLPSCRVLITGPSRTGDIEQRLTLGAHGPVALHVLVVREPA